jgi:DNA helicase-2/ATP-dependent DNA helicase PcrA
LLANIPYKIVGGVNFYSRKEVKDILSYLKTIDNGQDDLAVRRIINVPKRGIGAASIGKVQVFAENNDIDFYTALEHSGMVPGIGKATAKIQPFVDFIEQMKQKAKSLRVEELIEEILEETGYVRDLEAENDEDAKARIENIDELISKAAAYSESAEEPSLNGFLEEVALVADIDSLDNDTDYVVLMTLHSAKGLEFPNVYLAGMEDGLFPSYMSITSDEIDANGTNTEIEEERRLAYVGITRAKEHLTITSARMRMVRGETQFNKVSRFVKEIPEDLLQGAVPEQKMHEEKPKNTSTFQKAKQAFRAAPTNYGGEKKPVYTAVTNQHSFSSASTQKTSLSYAVGDRVRHVKFGDGEVKAIVEGGRDYEVTVDFDKAGTKKMFAAFAKLKKI